MVTRMTWSSLSLFVLPFLVASALPGPAQGAFVATVLSRGKASALPFVVGMVAGNAVWLIAAIGGLASVALRYESVFVAIKWVGIAYLLLVAWKLWTTPVTLELADGRKHGGFAAGAALTLGNPKAVVFFGAILPQAFDLTSLSLAQAGLIVLLGVVLDLAVQGTYLLAATKARRFIATPQHLRTVNRGAAVLMCGCAALIARRP